MPKFAYDHIHLRSPDPEATARFYQEMLDAEVIRTVVDGKPRIDLKIGGVDVLLAPVTPGDGVNGPPQKPHQGLDHFGLRVENLDAAVAELKAKGVHFTVEPKAVRPGLRIAFMRGPENVVIELVERR